ncbi:cadherin-like domain-containing protein [Luteolibacter yonseiensis]|uniref:Cadherin-like domain-containing protein n=2 Tax=Luteolibacter yonseiensis TaxID=1144680 RepID=A0A934R8S7_9BACT|nr:cadherin-like domain-containing protein [Luteolibacter yonseiensis]
MIFIRLLAIAGLLSATASGLPAFEQITVGNVTSHGASVAWKVTETSKPGLKIYTDAAGTEDVTNSVRVEIQTLQNSRREVSSTPEARLANRTLQAAMGVKKVAITGITGLDPATRYFVRPLALSEAGAELAAGALTEFTTASGTAFIPEARQLLADLSALEPANGNVGGALLVVSQTDSKYPLISVVGDGNVPSSAYFDLTQLLDSAGTINLLRAPGELELSFSWLGLPETPGTFQPNAVPYTGDFVVAAVTRTTFVGQGEDTAPQITPVDDQIAVIGQTFTLGIQAMDLDLPISALVYSLEPGTPAGISIDSATGVLTWTPTASPGAGVYPVTVNVHETANPSQIATTTFSIRVRANSAPVAGADSTSVMQGQSVAIKIQKLLLNDSDADGDVLTASLPGPLTSQGGTITLLNGKVTYTPPDLFTGTDTFTYSLSDGFGGTATGNVTVTVLSAFGTNANPVGLSSLPDGTMGLRMVGIPGRSYVIQASSDMVNWTTLATKVAGPNGIFEFVDADAAGFPTRFYRLALP